MPEVTIDEAFQIAMQHHQAGRLAEAEGVYRQILSVDPRHAEAQHLLGVIAHQLGRSDVAVEMISVAIAMSPHVAAFHSNLGEAYRNLGRLDDAMAAYRRAIEIEPGFPEAHFNLGNVLRDRGRLDEAMEAYQRAVRLKPDYADAYNNIGVVLSEIGRFGESVAAYRRAIHIFPGNAEAHNNLGNALREQGDIDGAIAACHRALQIRPPYPSAQNNLGNALRDRCQLAAAAACYRAALQLVPDFAEAWNNLGGVLKEQGLLDEAIPAYRRAIELNPDYIQAHSNLIFALQYLHSSTEAEIFHEHCRWNERHARPLAKFIVPHTNAPGPDRRLRIGFVSPDLREHSVAFFFEGLLAAHDRAAFEFVCYSDFHCEDSTTKRLRGHADEWHLIAGMTDCQVTEKVRADRIDILVDLAGHTARNRLPVFARKPAPVQVTWLGYSGTTGLTEIDCRITDVHADPHGSTEHLHSEGLVRLPETFACFRPANDAPPVIPLPALECGRVTFGVFHVLPKMNDRMLESWSTILKGVPGSRLMMVATGLDDAATRQRYAEFFGARGIDAARLEFLGRQDLQTYLSLHGKVDVLLDCHPFSGHTVACHALWMGVPVVTLTGAAHRSRMVTSVLMNLGAPEWIARTAKEYVSLATGLVADLPKLASVRAGLRGRMAVSPVTDAARFARNFDRALREMWRGWCAKQTAGQPL